MHIVTILNPKGGVGKTCSTHHLSGSLALEHGLRVLVVDADPQANLTQGWWGPSATRDLDPTRTIAAVLGGRLPEPEDVIHATGVPRLSLLPGSRFTQELNDPKPFATTRAFRESIREFLDEVRDSFDVVLIDTPPSPYGCGLAALTASDSLLIPVQPEDYGIHGIVDALDFLDAARGEGLEVRLLGYLLTMVRPRQTFHRSYEDVLRSIYGRLVFAASLPQLVEFAEAIAARLLIQQYKPTGSAAKAVKFVAGELVSRIAGEGAANVEERPSERLRSASHLSTHPGSMSTRNPGRGRGRMTVRRYV